MEVCASYSRMKKLLTDWIANTPSRKSSQKTRENTFARKYFRHYAHLHSKNGQALLQFIHYSPFYTLCPFSILYIMPKIHKSPMEIRPPVVSYSGSFLYELGIWCNDQLKKVSTIQRSYFPSSLTLLKQLCDLELPAPGAKLFTANAKAMYTNIPTKPALLGLSRYLCSHYQNVFLNTQREALFNALSIVMRNNYFTFGDTYCWHQKDGAAMGTPPSPSWATMYFSPHKNTCVDEFPTNIIYYKRFIDDIFGIWIPTTDEAWDSFKTRVNDCEGLIWEFSELSQAADFMDLTLTIHEGRIHSSLHENPLDDHLYIPPHSAHPPGITTGLINGIIHRIVTLCSDENYITQRLRTAFSHLVCQGYSATSFKPAFARAILKARAHAGLINTSTTPSLDSSTILLRLAYYPKDPPSSALQQVWQNAMILPPYDCTRPLASIPSGHTRERISLRRMIVCYSCPPNIGNLLSNREFAFKSGPPVSSFLD
jgi:hypothetical protein